jgi:hypothetical protein
MKKLQVYGLVVSVGFAGATLAQETATPPNPSASTEAEGATSDEAPARRAQEGVRERSEATTSTKATTDGGGRRLVGASVVTRTNAPLGQVTEVVFDSKQQPAFVIISTEDQSSAVPYAAASSMMSGDKVVIDQSKLQAAPKLKQGEWKDQSPAEWQADAERYWNKG